ncbi:type II toxin-antitoxin system HipA family toxin [Pleomorphomonas diazotrophica]|uniref:type II toxin-antitoxin system HipA family toxin n=1 Tax=Pleomorphomonas diazotrophica TaxID=1166257 RepID=UPI001FCEF881|nr:type II toxin-antitoxin system HipA family toxin [Pleomorphomonas diazotrophica]
MSESTEATEAYVWVWLPGETQPVVAGRLAPEGRNLLFNYGRSYLARADAIPLYEPELPLRPGILPLPPGLSMPSALRDAVPDAWGRRVILNRLSGTNAAEPGELTYLLQSGSDRIGALDFQASPSIFVPRATAAASIEQLMDAARLVEDGVPLPPDLDAALLHGSSIGGARPKALIDAGDEKYIAKFSSSTDITSVVKAEFIAMRLAALAGIDAAKVRLVHVSGKDVLLIRRFDRIRGEAGWQRRAMVSALTLLGLDEMMARYASYQELATVVRHRFTDPKPTLRELFARIVFNILSGNTDDHARNHAAFWDGHALSLTPAYDICPQGRAGREATQAMLIDGDRRLSQLSLCLDAAPNFLISRDEATAIAARQIATIRREWQSVCDEAALGAVDRDLFWRRQFLNPFAFEGAPEALREMAG